jgi:hypothetical protein
MKNKRQYRDSAMFAMIGYVGIIITILVILLGLGSYTGFNKEVQEGLGNDPRPTNNLMNYTHPNCFEVTDSLQLLEDKDPDMMYHRWEGKEGQSEFGEYVPTDTWNQGECGDEYKMWIGKNGDTIWE